MAETILGKTQSLDPMALLYKDACGREDLYAKAIRELDEWAKGVLLDAPDATAARIAEDVQAMIQALDKALDEHRVAARAARRAAFEANAAGE